MPGYIKNWVGLLFLAALVKPAFAMPTYGITYEILPNFESTIVADKDTLFQTYVVDDAVFDKMIVSGSNQGYEHYKKNDSNWVETDINKEVPFGKAMPLLQNRIFTLGSVEYARNSNGKVFTTFINFKAKGSAPDAPLRECKLQFSVQYQSIFATKGHVESNPLGERSSAGFYYGMHLIDKSAGTPINQMNNNNLGANKGVCFVKKVSVDHKGISLVRKITIELGQP